MMKTVTSRLVFQLKLAKIMNCPPKMNSDVTEQLIYLIELGVHFVFEDEAETDNILEWTIALIKNMMTFLACRSIIRSFSFMKKKK